MKKEILILSILGIIGQIVSLVGILFFSETNDSMIINLFSFVAFSLLACVVLFVDKKQQEKKIKNELEEF